MRAVAVASRLLVHQLWRLCDGSHSRRRIHPFATRDHEFESQVPFGIAVSAPEGLILIKKLMAYLLRYRDDLRKVVDLYVQRFGPLTPSERSANLIAGDGRRTAFSAPNKELSAQPKQQSQINCPARPKSPLTGESPIQVSCEPEAGTVINLLALTNTATRETPRAAVLRAVAGDPKIGSGEREVAAARNILPHGDQASSSPEANPTAVSNDLAPAG